MDTNARATIAASCIYAGAVAMVTTQTPAWCAAIALACVCWRVLLAGGVLATPRNPAGTRFVLGAVTALFVLLVLLSFRTLNGLNAGTALLVLMGALKVMEAGSRRDDGIVLAVALFLLLAAALGAQSLWRLPFYLLLLWGACTAITLVAHGSAALTVRVAMRLAARALLMALPLAAACFLFFPRLTGQFWALPRSAAATTGLGDEMSPGAIDRLTAEYEPAFRARFVGAAPLQEQLYWRGPVLNSFDGFTWRRERSWTYFSPPLEQLGAPLRYRITLEPTNRPWVYSLETLDASPRHDLFMTHDRQLLAPDALTDVTTYDMQSHLKTRTLGALSALGWRYETRLPPERNPRARALALQLRARAADDAEFSRLALDWFRDNGLEYTLEPGATSVDSVDSTLFDNKRGFCGHFASAYANLMRAAGVPARVVTGYLGGEWNPVGSYYIVRQSDAHAWTEVWLEGSGWTRIDPTAVVAPERLQRGVYDLLSAGLPESSLYLHRSGWLSNMSRLWDGANQWWQEQVLDFSLSTQLNLLSKLGFEAPDWRTLGWAFSAVLTLWIVWISLALRRAAPRVRPDRIGRAWLRLARKLQKIAPARAPAEGPLDFARRIGSARPELAQQIERIALLYAHLRYGPAANNDAIAELEREVRQLRM